MMLRREVRRVVKLGNSKILTLPPWWLVENGVGAGSEVIVTSRGRNLTVRPMRKEAVEVGVAK